MVISVIISFIADRKKTKKAFIVGAKKLWKITPPFISILIGVSIILYLISFKNALDSSDILPDA